MHSVIDQIYYSQELSLNQTLELGETLRGQPMINPLSPQVWEALAPRLRVSSRV